MEIRIKRAYQPPAKGDGFRVLVDRLWPRGVKKESLHADLWLKEIAPSNELRHWFDHDPTRWEEFENRYRKELDDAAEVVEKLQKITQGRDTVTLLFGTKDKEHNQAVVLRDYLLHKSS